MIQVSGDTCPTTPKITQFDDGTLAGSSRTFKHDEVFYQVQLSAKTRALCYVDPNKSRKQPVKPPYCWDPGKDGSLLTASLGTELITDAEAATAVKCSCGNDGKISCPTPTPTPTPTSCGLYILNIKEPCEKRDSAGNCTDYKMNGTHGGDSSNATLNINTSGQANQLSCLLDNLQHAFYDWKTDNKAERITTFKGTPNSGDLADNKFSFSGSINSYKYSPQNVIQTLWRRLQRNSGLPVLNTDSIEAIGQVKFADAAERKAIYDNVRNNYINCADWADERDFNPEASHDGNGWGFGGGANTNEKGKCIAGRECTCHDGTVAFDSQCRLVTKSAVAQMCGGKTITGRIDIEWLRGTPISLIFNLAANPLLHYTVVRVPLDPGNPDRYWEWRGSNDAPLLVYDPQHVGAITSAQQLFGNWTFGGKRMAALNASSAKAWRDGFEALAELDRDLDGKISGEELEPLGLWFDQNRDAVSQAGEVRSIRETGVTTLYVSRDKVDATTGDITSTIGYERMVDGKVVSGPAVDWSARGNDSASSVVLGRLLEPQSAQAKGSAEPVLTDQAPYHPSSQAAARKAHDLATGVWMVRVDTAQTAAQAEQGVVGLLAFDGGETEQLRGMSLIELGVSGSGNVARIVKFSTLMGDIKLQQDNNIKLSFISESNGSKLENSATIDATGVSMSGSTTARLADGTSFGYRWSAKRIIDPAQIDPKK